MQFTSTIIALVAALAMVAPTQATSILSGILGGKRSIISARDVQHWTRAMSAADKSLAIQLQDCMNDVKDNEVLVVTHVAGNTYKLAAKDGSWRPSCITIADSYIQHAKAVDGKLSKNADGSYNIEVKDQDKAGYESLIAKTAARKL